MWGEGETEKDFSCQWVFYFLTTTKKMKQIQLKQYIVNLGGRHKMVWNNISVFFYLFEIFHN